MKMKKCAICDKEFQVCNWTNKYCSFDCAKEWTEIRNKRNREKQEAKNLLLFQELPKKSWKIDRVCKVCKKNYSIYASQIKFRGSNFCSNKCKLEDQRVKMPKKKVLDLLWSKIIKDIAWNKCEYCWAVSYLNSHHIFSRNNHSVRRNIDNWICLCAKHHMLWNFSAHKSPIEFAERLKETRWEERYNNLRFEAKQLNKKTYDIVKIELDNKKDELKNIIPKCELYEEIGTKKKTKD